MFNSSKKTEDPREPEVGYMSRKARRERLIPCLLAMPEAKVWEPDEIMRHAEDLLDASDRWDSGDRDE